MEELAVDDLWLMLVKDLLDTHEPFELLNDRALRQAMRELLKRVTEPHPSRADVMTHAFVFAAELERSRVRAMLTLWTWPVHDAVGEGVGSGAPDAVAS